MDNSTTIQEYLRELSSREPVPGGGGTSALGGALGMALAGMVGNLTLGKKKYAAYEGDIRRLLQKSQELQAELAELIARDAIAFEPLSEAYRLPKGTKEQAAYRESVMESALLEASLVPLAIVKKAAEGLDVLEELLEKGSVLAVSDTGVAAAFLRTAINGAALNVYINTKLMKNREKAEELNRETLFLQEEGTRRADLVYRQVTEKLMR